MLKKCILFFGGGGQRGHAYLFIYLLKSRYLHTQKTCLCSDVSELMECLGCDTWRCVICSKEIKRRCRMKDHIENWHMNSNIKYPCELCGKTYATRNSLQNHTAVYHKNPLSSYWRQSTVLWVLKNKTNTCSLFTLEISNTLFHIYFFKIKFDPI